MKRIALGALALVAIGGLVFTSIQAWRSVQERGHEHPVVREGSDLGTIGEFAFTERSGKEIGKSDLSEKVWIANFIFTNCPGVCPKLSAEMSKLQEKLSDVPVRLVSFTVDPQRDTPQRLREYADLYDADSERWLFLTGKEETLHRFIEQSFRLAVGQRPEGEEVAAMEITHSGKFVLVAPEGRIRGYFDATDPASMEKLQRLARGLCESKISPP